MKNIDKIHVGDCFGEWEVLGLSSKKYYVKCKCGECGEIQDIRDSALLRGKSTKCFSCMIKSRKGKKLDNVTQKNIQKNKQKYVGKEVNGFVVTDVFSVEDKFGKHTECKYICSKCGKESQTRLERLKRIKHCVNCNRNIGDKISEIDSEINVDSSNLYCVKSRMNNKTINKNSATGYNGVSQLKNGQYRAYINFQRKQYNLGSYDSLDDAVKARKQGEEIMYQPYLEKNAGWEERVKERLETMKKEAK